MGLSSVSDSLWKELPSRVEHQDDRAGPEARRSQDHQHLIRISSGCSINVQLERGREKIYWEQELEQIIRYALAL